MFIKDIENAFTNTVAYYINNGYRIHYNTMGGHQGELAKIDLTDGKEIIRVLLESNSENCEAGGRRYCYLDFIKLSVGKNTDKVWGNSSDIIWNHHLEIISEYKFYKIGQRWASNFYGTKEEAIAAQIIHFDRLKNNPNSFSCSDVKEIQFNDKAKKIVLSFMKKQRKCSSITTKQINKVCKTIRFGGKDEKEVVKYYVYAKGSCYRLK